MIRLGRDKLRMRATSFGVDRSQAACLFEAFDLVKEIGQTCDRSATVRPARRTLNRRMVTAAEPVYSTCSTKNQEEYASTTTHWNRPAPQPVHLLRAVGERTELFDGLEVGGSAALCQKLRPGDEIAVEVTGNTRLFHDAVASHVARVVAVDPNQFQVISHSVKKTDPNDARNLALYLEKDLLPEVRMKDKTQAQLASLTQTRDTLVKLRTALKNKINNILSAHGINLEKEALSSEKKLNEVLAMKFDPMIRIELNHRRTDPKSKSTSPSWRRRSRTRAANWKDTRT